MRKIYAINLIASALLALLTFSFNTNAQNLVINGDFETWTDAVTPAGWDILFENANQESDTIHGGTYSCKHIGGTKKLAQKFSVVAGKTYVFSGWYLVQAGDGTDFRPWCQWMEGIVALTDNADILHPSGYFPSLTEWQQFSYTMTAPAAATDFYLEFRTYSKGVVYIDDVSFVETTPVVAAPIWATDYPMIVNINATNFEIAVQTDKDAIAYYLVLPTGSTAPTVAEVMAGTGSAGAVPVAKGTINAAISMTSDTVENLTLGDTYDVYIVAADLETVPNVQADLTVFTIKTSIPLDVLVNVTFDSDLTPFTAVSITGAQVWAQSSYSGNGYAKVSGYSGGNQDNQDWLISPAIDLDASTENVLSFLTAAANFAGPELGVFISTNFTGTYDSASVVTASWTDISSQVTLSAGAYAWTESGSVDLSTYSGKIYVGFKYLSSTVDGAKTYEVDDFKIKGYLKPGSDASLSNLSLDAATVTGFDAAKLSYTIELPMGTTAIPAVTYTTTDATATAVISNATDLAGDNAARTATIVVTAQDGTTVQTYTVLFNPILEAATISVFRNGDETRTYVVTGEVLLTYKNTLRNQKYVQDATGGMMIDDSKGVITTVYEVGDKIKGLKGSKLVYNGLVEFVPTADPGAAVSSGNAVEPVVITIAQFNGELNTYESTYVTIEDVVFTDAGTTITADAKANYAFTVGDVAGVMRTNYLDLDYMGGILPSKSAVSGIVIQYKGTAQIMPRSATDFYVYNTVATLSALKVSGDAVEGFTAGTLTYAVALPFGTTSVPEVTYTTTNDKASAVVTNATNLAGDEAARTTTVVVTAEDGTTASYSIVFTVDDNTGIANRNISGISAYPVPAADHLTVTGLAKVKSLELLDVTGKVIYKVAITGEKVTLNTSNLHKGMYFLRTESQTLKFIKK